jgi:hypothetical protein
MLTTTTGDLQIRQRFARCDPLNLLGICTFAGDEDDVRLINDLFCVLHTIGFDGLEFLEVVLVGVVPDELERGGVPKGEIFCPCYFLRGESWWGISAKTYVIDTHV